MKTYSDYHAHIQLVAKKLEGQIKQIQFENLAISEYSKKYWGDNLRKIGYVMQCNTFLLAHACWKSGKQLSELTVLDHGGGTGSITLLAKACGINKVLYNDIYDVSCADAKTVASALQLVADDYICADSDELRDYFKNTKLNCDCVVSRNVIEHIYNLENYFKHVAEFSNRNLVVCLATTANMKNPLVSVYTRKIQRTAELKGTKGKWQKERDSNSSFLEIRKKIIRENYPQLSEEKVERYAMSSRGLQLADIIAHVQEHEKKGSIPALPNDPTNTCDPNTGNRTENLIPISAYQHLMEKNGFEFAVKAGFYNVQYQQKILNLVTPFVNFIIRTLPFTALSLAPFILLIGVRKEK